jgi:hypothetical protein
MVAEAAQQIVDGKIISLWGELNIRKTELYVKHKEHR